MPTVTLASANRVALAYVPESSFGDIPTTGNPYALRYTGESLNFDLTKENDKEINSAAQLTSTTTVGAQAAGDIKVHMQYAEYDRFFAAVMRNTWAVFGTNGVGTTFSGSWTVGTLGSVASVITAGAATSGSSLFTTLQPGQWFRLNAPSNAADGKFLRVSTTIAPTSTTITLDVNTPLLAVGTSVAGCSVASSRVSNGTTLTSFTIEKQMLDVGQYFSYRGQYVSKFSTSFASKQLTEGSFTFLGKDSIRNTATQLTGTLAASQAYNIQNAVTGVGNIWENGAPLSSTYIKSMSLDIDSALRAQDAIGTLGLVGVGIGNFVAKGSLEVYFADGTLYDKFINDTFTSITLSTKDPQNNGYVFTFPRVQLTGAKVVSGAKDTDLMASFEYTAYGDVGNANAALRKALFIDRVGAAVTP